MYNNSMGRTEVSRAVARIAKKLHEAYPSVISHSRYNKWKNFHSTN